jgi:signal transduction histidine kinase
MRERAAAIGALLSIRSAPGEGTEILLIVRHD